MFIKIKIKIVLLLYVLLLSFKICAINVIANLSVKVDTLSVAQLRRIYSMRQVVWPSGMPIIVYVLPSKAKLHQDFSKQFLHMFPYQLDRIWNKLTYSGMGTAPIVVTSPQLLLNAVIRTPGAIGYTDMAAIKLQKIHIISIKG